MNDDFAPDEEIADGVKARIQEEHDRNARIAEFIVAVDDCPGQLGVLFRHIAHTYREYRAAELAGGVTAGEETRMNGVLEEAMSTLDWLREGEVQ